MRMPLRAYLGPNVENIMRLKKNSPLLVELDTIAWNTLIAVFHQCWFQILSILQNICSMVYLRTPHIGRTKASDVACPAPSPPSRFTKLFHQSPPPPNSPAWYLIRFLLSDLPSDVVSIAHSGFPSLSLSPISFQRTTTVGFRDVQRRPDQVPLSRYALSQRCFFLRNSDFRWDFICCCNRGCLPTARAKLSIRRTKFSSAGAGTLAPGC